MNRTSFGASTARTYAVGIVFLMIAAATVTLLIAKSRGVLDPFVRVSAALVNVGDGLPQKSDVKFRGVLVGFVDSVQPAEAGQANIVNLNVKPQFAAGIPDSVTARVVPSNVFAVSSVQLVDNGESRRVLQGGDVIKEDQTLPTVLFQTTLQKFRQVLAAIGRDPDQDGVGWLTALGDATSGRGDRLQDAGRDLNDIVNQLNTVVAAKPGASTISALSAATAGLRDSAPDLLDALDSAVKPMRTIAEKRVALHDLLASAAGTVGTLGDGFDHQTDRLINITTQLTPVVGTLADHGGNIHSIVENAQAVVTNFVDQGWNWDTSQPQIKAVIALTPTRTYVRADCPRYGDMLGPSCSTAPEVPTAPALTPSLNSMGLPLPPGVNENRPNDAPPRGSVLPPDAPRPEGKPQPPLPAPAAPTDEPLPPAASPPPADNLPPGLAPQSAVIGGNVGPVGSRQEKEQMGYLLGGNDSSAAELLAAPVLRGMTVAKTDYVEADR
ncbi:MlaD family protein [Mycobacteroides abscessus]|uniref:MlaD family protein n=1 Tax=Mycobacteroides abscessus TaxID=36809 RepID=UPI00092C653E|nr:MCE family protein [Mycobacteroides abscessus]MDO3333935.1 MCE family protein [Mycobacteroides abscessus subsp. bolletii]QSM86856.1 MCE family protein [Mycobacteroides abscessus subsp. bolletii]SIB90439.1 Mce protein Mce5A [Mycobacteroides abscessus subsp. bolletii]SKS87222.1 Mce protein Mce5A [Mycobacteroides abscessus subsp. bolletii]SKT10675.1 Mce protein Mce5A [Mycobacteroides abscessus subsp. bolletii]